ncbi:uS10/mL48 family ribosomal protein [Candidatus Nesciobacter abundans]|uniref:Small ribosomal subunit protein uS10 n=1 Tax=Candidatus Nesciobacter abundans TaxID=2601668 RepID=A0A5C0UGP3_9PROT|nr:uS10/mL48 family ribosomal protein [Candidatus Nesciobacter abundans]QEK38900.1 30S ribosomal protein S10 [Candidatus Nesciobacter abundans]
MIDSNSEREMDKKKVSRKPSKKIKEGMSIVFKSCDGAALDSCVAYIVEIARSLGLSIKGPVPMPTTRKVFTVLKSPHIDKRAMDQFELRYMKRVLFLKEYSKPILDLLESKMVAGNYSIPRNVEIEMKV